MHQVTDIEHHDRVAEVYFRKAFSEVAQDKLIRRIDWICNSVEGNTVFDIGCSQGVVEYLLAQKGKKVVGVDIDQVAISYGQELLEKLPDNQSQNVKFICDDIYRLKSDEIGKFDTVLMTEVIEHFDDPRSLILKSIEFCKDGGLLIVTTPFGLHRAPDHKFTFYNSRIESCFKGVGDIISLEITDKYYCIAIRVNQNGSFKLDSCHNSMQEAGFESIENMMQDNIDHLKQSLISSKENYLEQKNKVVKVQESLSNYKQQNIQLKERLTVVDRKQKDMVGKSELESVIKSTIDKEVQELLSEHSANYKAINEKLSILHSSSRDELKKTELQRQWLEADSKKLKSENRKLIELNERLKLQFDEATKKLKSENKKLIELNERLKLQFDEATKKLKSENKKLVELNERLKLKFNAELSTLNEEKKLIVYSKSESVRRYNEIRDSFSYRLGYKIVEAFTKPRLKTVLLPFELVKLFAKSVKERKLAKSVDTCSLLETVAKVDVRNINNVQNEASLKYQKVKLDQSLKENTYKHIINYGVSLPTKLVKPSYEPSEIIFYLCHMSMPLMENGYATRTHHLVKTMKAQGIELRTYTRLGYPFDLQALRKKADKLGFKESNQSFDDIDSVDYHVLRNNDFRMDNLTLPDYIYAYADAIVEQALQHKPKLLHAASDYRNGLAAVIAGCRLGIPVRYEMRGLWHVTKASKHSDHKMSSEYKAIDYLERLVVNSADYILTLTNALSERYIIQGIERSKFRLLPNGVDLHTFSQTDVPSLALPEKYGLLEKRIVVIGYIGSILKYEGLDLLIEAAEQLIVGGISNFKILIVGDGEYLDSLKEKVQKGNLQYKIIFAGRVSHKDVPEYYSIIDICPFPRLPVEVCEIVSPIKPLEAMAMGKAVVVSSVEALSEMVQENETGLIFNKGDAQSLYRCLKQLITDTPLRNRISKAAIDYTKRYRSWDRLVENALK